MQQQQHSPLQRSLQGQTVLVTGGASVPGAALCEVLLKQGARVMLAGVREDQAREMPTTPSGDLQRVKPLVCDVSDPADVALAIGDVLTVPQATVITKLIVPPMRETWWS
jgi:NAD(P)-dependent dehydrogenase (short-subunit alcohol dehydrogenase family)